MCDVDISIHNAGSCKWTLVLPLWEVEAGNKEKRKLLLAASALWCHDRCRRPLLVSRAIDRYCKSICSSASTRWFKKVRIVTVIIALYRIKRILKAIIPLGWLGKANQWKAFGIIQDHDKTIPQNGASQPIDVGLCSSRRAGLEFCTAIAPMKFSNCSNAVLKLWCIQMICIAAELKRKLEEADRLTAIFSVWAWG